ncbi:heavy metal translocating P-type ATPase [Hydrogenophaga sp. 2FB]|uniref:heavy metal translocating P-type ATPase n=1 Tax=Hydrogenophaga sp. 2FB TaxID=2502187 RepID=UPI0010F81863|nr:heavy metal translocating P-type ATPase [Hydrogenophaga sp. 2FB]
MDDKHTAPHPQPATAAASTWLHVPSMCCAAEFNVVEKELRRLSGVREVAPDFIRRAVRVQHDAVPAPELVAAAARSGFEVRLGAAATPPSRGKGLSGIAIKAVGAAAPASAAPPAKHAAHGDHDHDHSEHEHHDHAADHATAPSSTRLIIGGVLALAAEGAALAYGDASLPAVALALSAIGLAGLDTYRKGLVALRRFNLNINALMTVAVTGAAILGQWPEAAMVMVLFAIAEMIEDKSLDRARRAVEGLMSMAPDMATVQQGTAWREVPAASVALGTLVRVRPGERIALDGTVASGASAVDQAAITGESVPVDKAVGDKLFAGTINQNGELLYRVGALADDSTLARIIRAVQEAQATRAPTQRFVDTFASYYTPAVFAVAVAMAVLPPLLMGADWMTWVYRALVLLVIACPCALVLSTPISVVSGLTAAARRGILVKGGLYLEQGHRLKVLALDKTGTLTQGKPVVTDVLTLQGSESEMLARATALAGRSDHPVSKAIAAHGPQGAVALEVTGFTALQGRGTEGFIGGERYRLGNHRLLEESGACTPELEARLDALEEQGKTAVVLVRGDQAIGIFAIADRVRAESADAIAQLKALGVRPIMLTGDNRHTAEAIARQVGIDDVRSELLPEDKLKVIEALSAGNTVVGMVGDGINDAPALAKANIGFAMGAAGTDTAIETADIALMDDDPRKLAEFIRLSRATRAVLWQNIAFALGIKVVFLTLAVTGQATLWMAVFADMGGSLLVVFNGLRLLRHRAA